MAEQGGLKVQCFIEDSYVPIDKIRATLTPSAGQTPYSMYDLKIEREGFESLVINGIQIFPTQVAIQQCFLTVYKFQNIFLLKNLLCLYLLFLIFPLLCRKI